MPTVRLDLCVLADLRVGDVATACHAAAMEALAAAGYRIGVLAIASDAIAADSCGMDPQYERLLAEGRAVRLAPGARVDCALALAFDARLFFSPLPQPLSISAAHRIVTVERPGVLAAAPRSGLDRLAEAAATALGGAILWAPTTSIARDALAYAVPDWHLTAQDWSPVAPEMPLKGRSDERARPVVGTARIARARPVCRATSSRTFETPVVLWRMRGAPEAARPEWPRPAPVELWPDDRITLADFLTRIDLLANPDEAADDPCPVEALMALAAGVVPFLPPEFRPVFGGTALYGRPKHLPRTAVDFHADRGLADALRATGQDLLREVFSAKGFTDRVASMIGGPRTDSFAPAILGSPRTRVLFYSTNGVGMGHLTRQLAIARRLPGSIEPVFISHSQAVDVVRRFGFAAEYIPYHAAYAQARAHWNAALAETLGAAIGFYLPSALVFDGNVPFVGLLEALDAAPAVARVWVRRGMWGPNRDLDALERGHAFDLIVEPEDVASALDDGPTADRHDALAVPPIRLLDGAELPDRATACAALGLNAEAVNVLVAPGSGNNFDASRLVAKALKRLAGRQGIGVAVAEWKIAQTGAALPAGVARLADYPFALSLPAFDFAIAAAGYNTFAEHLDQALPTIWIPNEHAEQDRQILRAMFAEQNGLGLMVRVSEDFGLQAALTRMLDPAERRRMQDTGRAFATCRLQTNGAEAAAAAIAGLARSSIVRGVRELAASG